MKLAYAIKFVADMNKAVAFHRDTLGLMLKFQSPEWSEFLTGDTTLAVHSASDANPVGKVQFGFNTDDLAAFYAAREMNGVTFTDPPREVHGHSIARFLDSEGTETSIGG
jgi:catechol 2,3-dioxygenase-like lactoylglutathione lyase family enzyme